MSDENEFNARHFLLMQETLLKFKKSDVLTLGTLVRRLDEINSILKNPGEQWDKQFIALWLPLELAYADTLEEARENLSASEEEIIQTSIEKLSVMVGEKTVDFR